MFHKINFHIILLTLILVLGFGLRTYRLTEIPSGFFADEASIGYNAYTILTKGTDEYGTSFPIFFRAFGEYKSPVQIYTTVPFVALFGLNEFSVRLPPAIFGTLTILAVYLLTKELFKRKISNATIIALLAAFFLFISPWHIHFSRTALEGLTPFVFFTILALYFFLKSRDHPCFLPISAIAFVLSIYSYFVARIFIPLLGVAIFLIYLRFFFQNKRETLISFLIAALLLLPLINHTLSPVGFSRWQQVNVFMNPHITNVPEHIINNYISHFSLDFLFLKGDIDMPGQFISRHSVRGIGELYLFQLPLIFLGFWYLFKKRGKQTLAIFVMWVLLYPVGSMFTLDKSAQATRSIVGVIPFQILSAIGLYWVINFFRSFERSKKHQLIYFFSIGVIIVIITASFLNFLDLYFRRYPLYSSNFWGWQYGAKDIVKYFVSKENEYDALIMAPEFNAPEIFFKFYAPNQCAKCSIGTPETTYNPERKQLFAITSTYIEQHPQFHFIVQKTVFHPNNTVAFQIGEIVE